MTADVAGAAGNENRVFCHNRSAPMVIVMLEKCGRRQTGRRNGRSRCDRVGHSRHFLVLRGGCPTAEFALESPCDPASAGTFAHLPACLIQPYGTLQAINGRNIIRSEEHTSELQSLMRKSYAVICL